MRRILLLLMALIASPHFVAGAQPQGEGEVLLTNWPSDDVAVGAYDLLPDVQSLLLEYVYAVEQDSPNLTLSLSWVPGDSAVVDGYRVALEDMPAAEIVAVGLEAEVVVDGRVVDTLSVAVDSMMLGPVPDRERILLPDLEWDNVFVSRDAEATRSHFEGFELRNLRISRIAFAAFDEIEEATVAGAGRDRTYRRPSRVAVYGPDIVYDVHIWLDWLFLSGGGWSGPRVAADHVARGARIGRAGLNGDERGRSRQRTGRAASGDQGEGDADDADDKKKRSSGRSLPSLDDDDDDDDDNLLVPAAVAAVAAVGMVAYAGGTVGMFSSPEFAPIGLSAGVARRNGGVLLQAAVNADLMTGEGYPRNLLVKLTGYRAFFGSPFQPAVGAGVLASQDGSAVSYEPSLSLGVAAYTGALQFQLGYDVLLGGVEAGLAFNFRNRPRIER